MSGRLIRVRLVNGDVRQGRYVSHDAEYLRLHDGLLREIELVMIREITDPRFEACLEST